MRSQYVTEVREVPVTTYKKEERTRTRDVCKRVARVETREKTYTVNVPETRTKTEKYNVKVCVPYTEQQEYTVMVPETTEHEVSYEVCVPYTEEVEETYTVCVPKTEQGRAEVHRDGAFLRNQVCHLHSQRSVQRASRAKLHRVRACQKDT